MAGLARSPLALLLMLVLAFAAAGAQARLLRGVAGSDQPAVLARAPRGLLAADGKDAKAADSWSTRDWPAARQVATSSGRGSSSFGSPAAASSFASSRSFGYTSNAQPYMMGGMSAPIYDSAWANRG